MTPSSDDEHAINAAQTEFRDGINTRDCDRAMSVIAEYFTWMHDGEPSFWGVEGRAALRLWILRLIEQGTRLTITPDQTRLCEGFALARGWHTLHVGPEPGPYAIRYRYFQTWEKSPDDKWLMSSFISNQDLPPAMLPQ
jgi:ketosteroid isomerase-like protein